MKKTIIIVCILAALVLLIPIPYKLKDGGTIHYDAILYDVYDVHRIDLESETGYAEGLIIKVFGIEIYDNTESESSCHHEHKKEEHKGDAGDSEDGEEGFDVLNPYFTGKVLEINEKGFLLEVTNTGNGCFAVGERVQVNTDLSGCPNYMVGDYLRISFDGKVALSLPPQVACVTSICKTDSEGNCID